MEELDQYELRRESVLGQALASFSASFLFIRSYVTRPTSPYTVQPEIYLVLSIFFSLLAFFLVIVPLNRFLFSKSERVAQILWLAISYTALTGFIIAWLDSVATLDPAKFWFHWFFWLGFVWFLLFSYHLIRSAWYQGQKLRSRKWVK